MKSHSTQEELLIILHKIGKNLLAIAQKFLISKTPLPLKNSFQMK